ncbi:MAG: Coenzyme F420 hydrogenase/dehydrogenase, beta subunit C-terminal domain [Clostridia bacterium]|nr:Coenzyme F420 hydrogenase/dehydrogenase, beta subunit C-terminal domain [Clostridia bacterium]
MINITDKSKCCGCSACYSVCANKCITMVQDEEGFLYPKVSVEKCSNCGLCEKVCPFNITSNEKNNKPQAFAVKNKNEEVRLNSSSGGVFAVLANYVLNNCGVVYGVAMDNDCKSALHIRVDNKNDLPKLFGSKYLQSNINNAFMQVREDLRNEKLVLFSGTPCQINGLRLFLNKDYKNLLLVDIICHGVPSPLVWEKYCEYIEEKYNSKIINVNFRKKKINFTKKIPSKKQYKIQYLSPSEDPYLKIFLRNYSLRLSCYNCNAKKTESMSDFTIADFWGLNNVAPNMQDNKGVSLVLINSEKGKEIFEKQKIQLIIQEVSFDKSIMNNPSYNMSSKKPLDRQEFFDDLRKMKYEEIKIKYCKDNFSLYIKIKRFVKKLIKLFCKKEEKDLEYGLLIKLEKNTLKKEAMKKQ